MDIYFSDFFAISPKILDKYGAFNISMINDLPLFIDPFLLFNSKKPEYQKLHNEIIKYLQFLRDKSTNINLDQGLIHSWYLFPEVKQNWFGFSRVGNSGAGLREDFAIALHKNLHTIFTDFGAEKVTRGGHLEKLCLIKEGVGRDKISDFTTNLIKDYLLNFTQEFARKYIARNLRKTIAVNKVRFNYKTETWENDLFDLPFFSGNYILLTPKDILTKDELWINKDDLFNDFQKIPIAISNEQLRSQINNYFRSLLPKRAKAQDYKTAISMVINKYPEVLDYYIRFKEDNGEEATNISNEKVVIAEHQYIQQIKQLSEALRTQSSFYASSGKTFHEAMARVQFMKDVIENKDGYRYFYINGQPIERESDLQIMYRLTWFASALDVNREVNNGRGPVDFKVSEGSKNSTLVEFKLAKNTQLERNLQNQVEIYKKASNSQFAIKVIIYFTNRELSKVTKVLQRLKLSNNPNIILIDARRDNKPSASKA